MLKDNPFASTQNNHGAICNEDHMNGTSRAIIMANKSMADNGKPIIVTDQSEIVI
jgi:hypothetical protein